MNKVTAYSIYREQLDKLEAQIRVVVVEPCVKTKVLRTLGMKFFLISRGLLSSDAIGELSSLILLRCMHEIATDAVYLWYRSEHVERYDTFYFADKIRMDLGRLALLQAIEPKNTQPDFEASIARILDCWKQNKEKLSIYFPNFSSKLQPVIQDFEKSGNPELLEELLEVCLTKLRDWRPSGKTVHHLFKETIPLLEGDFFTSDLPPEPRAN